MGPSTSQNSCQRLHALCTCRFCDYAHRLFDFCHQIAAFYLLILGAGGFFISSTEWSVLILRLFCRLCLNFWVHELALVHLTTFLFRTRSLFCLSCSENVRLEVSGLNWWHVSLNYRVLHYLCWSRRRFGMCNQFWVTKHLLDVFACSKVLFVKSGLVFSEIAWLRCGCRALNFGIILHFREIKFN